ncbi:F0F1 ATP synthase subunit epsilon [Paraphotobacterium marinum]|uniref:ATP synthase epsilon chain n=1 Tax=Paraphotobacterium marinum TaxID=1755811 RepID=A0A220VCK6_9GAMM|nr:F0F1 ATP synthase subunit epsilon [Paraphotobacterium marinum]ASK78124.1 F0F1 ATP synthase subunit epsilon [Paraphotobacterium marinum]
MAGITFLLEVVSAEKKLVSQQVENIRVTGTEGELGIYAGHTPLLTSIKPGLVKIKLKDGREEVIYLSGGVLEVQPNAVIILAETAIRGENLDKDKIEKARKQAEHLMTNSNSEIDFARASLDLENAMAKLRVIEMIKHRK